MTNKIIIIYLQVWTNYIRIFESLSEIILAWVYTEFLSQNEKKSALYLK